MDRNDGHGGMSGGAGAAELGGVVSAIAWKDGKPFGRVVDL